MEKATTAQSSEDSPSMTLLMRLQQLRQWQEKQRENLQRSNSFQNSISMNSSYESSISISPSSIPTSSVSHSLKTKLLLAHENIASSHLDNSISYSSDSCNNTQLLHASPKSSNSSIIPPLNFDQFKPASAIDISKTNLQPSCLVSSNTHSNNSSLLPIDEYKEQENLETKVEIKGERSRTSESNDSTASLSFNPPEMNLNNKGSSSPVKLSLDDETQISTGIPSVGNDFLSKPISVEHIDLETSPISLYNIVATNSQKSILNSEETIDISAENQDKGKEKVQNDNSEIKDKYRCNENNIEVNRNDNIHDNFDDIPIRTQSQNFQVLLSKNLEGNQIRNISQSTCAPKFSFLKKGVGSAATNTIDVDSGFGSASSISGNATKVESSTENKRKMKKTFLRKGEGTSRFGMKPPRLKKVNVNISTFKTVPDNLEYDNLRSINKDKLLLKNHTAQYSKNSSDLDGKTLGSKQSINLHMKEIPNTQYTTANIQNYNKSSDDNIKNQSSKKQNREVAELSAFEQLEELADDSSFCSNSSTVIQLLQKGLRSASSTPLRSPTPFDFPESPIPISNTNSLEYQTNQELLTLSQVLDQCKALVQLEKEGNSNITQEDIDYLVESILSDQTISVHSVNEYLKNLQQGTLSVGYSTKTGIHPSQNQKPRVHFRKEGVDVHEFETPDSDSESTLTDMQSIDEEVTDLVTTSDLEALAHLNLHGMLEHVPEQVLDKSCVHTDRNINFDHYYSEFEQDQQNNILKNTKKYDSVQKVLEFSPPRQPPNSASHLVWSIFGQKTQNKNLPQSKQSSNLKCVSNKNQTCTKDPQKFVTSNLDSDQRDLKKEQDSDKLDIDSHKTLLMAKICELENETIAFKKKNTELQKIQDSLKFEQDNLSKEREAFKKQMNEHENKLREAIDRERNRLWKERQELKQLHQEQVTLESARTQSLEIVMLKEKLADTEEDLKKKESSHQFAVRKFMDKIKFLEQENKKLKVDLAPLQILEKENLNLKHQIDRLKLGSKSVFSDKTTNKTQNLKKKVTIANAIKKSVEIKQKPMSINDVNKELDKELITNEETDFSIKDVYPSKNLKIENIERVTIKNAPKPKLPVKEVKDFTVNRISTLKKNHNELESKFEQPYSLVEESDTSFESYSSLPSPSKLVNHDPHKIRIAEQENVSTDAFIDKEHDMYSLGSVNIDLIDKEQDMHSPGSVNIDFTENCRSDGTKEIIYANGNKKEIFANGVTVMNYYNGDCKEQHKDKTVYIYGTDQTKQITFTDGKEIVEFPNGQKETTYPDGSSEIKFPDMSVKKISKDGTEICLMKDGTVVRTNPDGSKVFEFPGGQREVHIGSEKRREYPDGTIKILYDDERVETRYKNGRIRMKDKQGNILTDTHG